MKRWLGFLTVIGVLALVLVAPAIAQEEVYFPMTQWRTSTPEEQGMDSAALADFVNELPTLDTVDSLIIIRNGYIVTEVYWHPFTREMDHQWYSVSKSVTSALIGIALDLGYLNSLDDQVLSFFPEYTVDNLDDNKRAMTLRDLLTMRSGFDCDITHNTDPILELATTADAIQLGLDWRMADEPGTTWRYCQINTYLLMAILERASGMPAMDFAMRHLFTPLGIAQVEWITSQQGIPLGYLGLYLHPLDMAKIGYLYLMRGRWQEQQIISSTWIEASITQTQAGTWDPTAAYGYQWWTYAQPGDFFTGVGAGGQFVAVYPKKDLIVVLNASPLVATAEWDRLYIPTLMSSIVSSVMSDEAVPTNTSGMAALDAAVSNAQHPAPSEVPPQPEIAAQVSGLTYLFDEPWEIIPPVENYVWALRMSEDWQVQSLTFDFTPRTPTMVLRFVDDSVLTIPIGLDGVYQTVEHEDGLVAAVGRWIGTSSSFRVNMRFLMNTYRLELTCGFVEDRVRCSSSTPWEMTPVIQGTATRAS